MGAVPLQGRGADGALCLPAWPHLWIIWTQIVYLVFLKCYQCFLCAFVSPPQKEKFTHSAAQTSTQNNTSLGAIRRFPHDHQQNGGQINPWDTFHPHPSFLQAVPVQKCTEFLHKELIQESSAEGNTKMSEPVVFVTFYPFERKTSLPVILRLFLFVVTNTEDKAAIY